MCSDKRMILRFWLRIPQKNYLSCWRQRGRVYPGSRGPFSKYLIWNKPCLRFDKAPETLFFSSGICSWSSWVQFLRVHALVNDQLVASCQLGLSTLLRSIWIIRYESFAWVECRVRERTPYSGFHTPRFMIPFLWGETKAFLFFYQRGGGRWGVSNFWCYLQVVLVWLMHKHVHELGNEKSFHVIFPRETVD